MEKYLNNAAPTVANLLHLWSSSNWLQKVEGSGRSILRQSVQFPATLTPDNSSAGRPGEPDKRSVLHCNGGRI